MDTLIEEVRELAISYMCESDDGDDDDLKEFPLSIARFVTEYAYQLCHFPASFSKDRKIEELSLCKNSIAMACVDLYLKIGAEGQTSYSSNGISRHYKSDWINTDLLSNLPNYVRSL